VSRSRVVIVGGGVGGLACARRLAGRPVDVLLIDRRDYHQVTPLLYQVARALLTAPDISYPFRAAFRAAGNVHFLHADVPGVDLERRVVHTRGGDDVQFDYLVLATGSENNYFGNPALAAPTLSMKTLPQAQRLRNEVLACLEHAAQARDEAERRRWLTFAVIGGGPTGVEFVPGGLPPTSTSRSQATHACSRSATLPRCTSTAASYPCSPRPRCRRADTSPRRSWQISAARGCASRFATATRARWR
jgi:NADH dehydrogenase FAD-containing subunit